MDVLGLVWVPFGVVGMLTFYASAAPLYRLLNKIGPVATLFQKLIFWIYGCGKGKHVLFSFRYSHFCERVRLTMQYCGQEFEEYHFVTGLHYLVTYPLNKGIVRKVDANRSTLPILVTGDGTIITDSFEIMEHFAKSDGNQWLFPNDSIKTTTKTMGDELASQEKGGKVILFLWLPLLVAKNLMWKVWGAALTPVHSLWHNLFFYPTVKTFAWFNRKSTFSMDTWRTKHVKDLDNFFTETDKMLGDNAYYFGNVKSGADISLASLFYWCVLPPGMEKILGVELEELPEEMQEKIKEWRKTKTGQLIGKIYREIPSNKSN